MSEVAEITVQKIWEPFETAKPWRDGKRRGKVVSSEGVGYQCAETMLRQFSEGEVCKIEFKTFGDKASPGKEIIKKIWTGDNKPIGAPNVVHTASKPVFTRQRMDPADALGAFTTKAFEAFTVSGKIPLNRDAIATALDEIAAGYRQHNDPHQQSMADLMNDEIPFFPKSENPADA